ncbi:hypothetical protein TWF694_000390 [Orbilia ellipsospora]|uniref:1,3-beta-glucanosyltransferase n=1 Tax=Orbilia ellipsospora TaxID=2528407 RepID=A0AAV9XNF7_9PEZI
MVGLRSKLGRYVRPALAALLVASVANIGTVDAAAAPLTIKGNKFFNSQTGAQFFIKGVAYQLQAKTDPLVDKAQCALDAALMQQLGVNTIRVYQVDPTANHDDCMKIFGDAGIYLFVDLANYETGINEDNPYWSQTQLSSFAAVLDAFANYDNTVGFWIGNEVITKASGARAVYFVAAAVADIKTHIKDKKYGHQVYIGYANTDNADTRPFVQNYLACNHGTADSSIDFYGVNAYEWCLPTDTFETSGYQRLTGYLSDAKYDIPAFLSEDGCNTSPPRLFQDMSAVYGPDMSDWWSGSIVYEWINEANKFGLVTYGNVSNPATAVGGDPYARSGTPTPVSPDFNNLKTAWASVSPTSLAMTAYTPTNTNVNCPVSASAWTIDPSATLPTIGDVATPISGTNGGSGGSATTTSKPNSASSVKISIVPIAIAMTITMLMSIF